MPDFDAFWSHYPRRVAKAAARKAWAQTAGVRPPLPVLIAAIRRAQQQSDAWVRGYIPHAATWLRGERWDDEFTPLPAPDGKYSAFMRELTQQPPETIDVDSVKLG